MAQQMKNNAGWFDSQKERFEEMNSENSRSDSDLTDSSSDSDSRDSYEDSTGVSRFSDYGYERTSHHMGPPPPRQRRTAPSPEISGDVMQIDSGNKSLEIGSPQRIHPEEHVRPAHDAKYNEGAVIPASTRHDSPTRGLGSKLAAFEERAGPPTPLPAYNSHHENPNYTDLEDPQLSDALAKRLQAMHARNAEENHHYRIPPENAPPHMQMMVLLYQWAAWALDISDEKKRGRMIKWVNGRTLDFMMSGGRVPGYNLKELLEIAGVDPKELYGYPSATNKINDQLPAIISGDRDIQPQSGLENGDEKKTGADLQQDSHAFSAAKRASFEVVDELILLTDDDEEEDEGQNSKTPAEHTSTDGNAFKNRDGLSTVATSAGLHEGSCTITNDRKREVPFDHGTDQDNKRQKIETEDLPEDLSANHDLYTPSTVDALKLANAAYSQSPDDFKREQYRQSFFKAQINALLRNHQRSQIQKDLPEWSKLEIRLQKSGLSATIIGMLKEDYDEGWKTWNGSPFTGLPHQLQSSNTQLFASPKLPPSSCLAPAPARAQAQATPKIKIKNQTPNPKPKARKKVPDEEYDSADGEWTAAKTSVKTRRQYEAEIQNAAAKGKGGRGRGRGGGRGKGKQ